MSDSKPCVARIVLSIKTSSLRTRRKYKYNPKILQHFVEHDWSDTKAKLTKQGEHKGYEHIEYEMGEKPSEAIKFIPERPDLEIEAADADEHQAERITEEAGCRSTTHLRLQRFELLRSRSRSLTRLCLTCSAESRGYVICLRNSSRPTTRTPTK